MYVKQGNFERQNRIIFWLSVFKESGKFKPG